MKVPFGLAIAAVHPSLVGGYCVRSNPPARGGCTRTVLGGRPFAADEGDGLADGVVVVSNDAAAFEAEPAVVADILQRPEAGTEVEVAHARLGAVAVGHVDVGDVLGRLANRGRDVGLLDVDRKSTRLNSSHVKISYAVFCLKKKKKYPSISFSSSHIQ